VKRIDPQPTRSHALGRLHGDEGLDEEQQQASPSVGETDVLSMGGPDSLEDVEDSDD
jgi:hypothetical protein